MVSEGGDYLQAKELSSFQDAGHVGRPDDIPEVPTPQNYSPVSAVTSISSSSASIASSSSDDSDMTHTQNIETGEQDTEFGQTNSLGLTGYDDADGEINSEDFRQVTRRKPFAYDEDQDKGNPLSRDKTPRAHETPSICSVDTQGLLVPSSLASSETVSPASELDDPTNYAAVDGPVDTNSTAPASRQVTENELKDDVAEIEGMSSVGTLMLGAPVQT